MLGTPAVRDDYDFYLPVILEAGSVLDVGRGTGTLLEEARRSGHRGRLCGLDPAPGVFSRARRFPDVEWVLDSLEDQGWDQRFDLIVMTGHAFQAVVGYAELQRFLACVRRALVPGGTFAFETRNPAARAWEGWAADPVRVVLSDGSVVFVATRIDEGFDGRTLTFTHTFSGSHSDLPRESRSTLRFTGADELVEALNAAGLSVRRQYGDFRRGQVEPSSPEIVTFAAR